MELYGKSHSSQLSRIWKTSIPTSRNEFTHSVRLHRISVIAKHRAPSRRAPLPLWHLECATARPRSSQRDNPIIARRFNAGYLPAPARVPQGRLNEQRMVSALAHHFNLKTSVVPAGLGTFCGLNPALKCRAIVIVSLCDDQNAG
jgi:hypothetical protein